MFISRRDKRRMHHYHRGMRSAKRRLWIFFFLGISAVVVLWFASGDIMATLVLLGAVILFFLFKSATLRRYH